jgi:hypothetical protein
MRRKQKEQWDLLKVRINTKQDAEGTLERQNRMHQ